MCYVSGSRVALRKVLVQFGRLCGGNLGIWQWDQHIKFTPQHWLLCHMGLCCISSSKSLHGLPARPAALY